MVRKGLSFVILERILDGDLHQNVIETLPPQFKPRVESPVLQRRSLKRVYQLVDHENKLHHMPKTVQYRDPNLRGVQLKVEIVTCSEQGLLLSVSIVYVIISPKSPKFALSHRRKL